MTAPRLSEEQLAALERAAADDGRYGVVMDLVADLRAARAEAAALRARLEMARESLVKFSDEALYHDDYGGHTVGCAHLEGPCCCGLDDLRAALEAP